MINSDSVLKCLSKKIVINCLIQVHEQTLVKFHTRWTNYLQVFSTVSYLFQNFN